MGGIRARGGLAPTQDVLEGDDDDWAGDDLFAGPVAPTARRRAVDRLPRSVRRLSGVVVAPFSQALSSLLLQVAALRELGADGFAVFALLASATVLLTALSSGLVGDPLTVLDRGDPRIRSGLHLVAWVSTLAAGVVGTLVVGITHQVSWPVALNFGAGVVLYLVENLLRRWLMAVLKYWRIVAIDTAVLVFTVVPLVVTRVTTGGLTMGQILGALLISQAAGIVVGWRLLPREERWLAWRTRPSVRPVLAFGFWRGAQQAIRPGALTLVRILVVAAVGTTLFGELEAARVYTSPTMLIVNGLAGFFLASYAVQQHRPVHQLRRRADRSAQALAVAMSALCLGALAVLPWANRVLSDDIPLDRLSVIGWVVFAGVNAIAMPYVSLAAVKGRHVLITTLRLVEAVVSLAAASVALFVLDVSVHWTPLALSVSPLATAVVVRFWMLSSDPERKEATWRPLVPAVPPR